MSLSADRATQYRDGLDQEYPLAAAAKVFAGSLAAISAAGYLTPAAATAGLVVAGLSMAAADNSAGAAGAISGVVRRKCVALLKGSSLTQAMVGEKVYVVDDETVGARPTGTAVSAESLVADAGGTLKVFTGMLAHGAVDPGSVSIAATVGAAAKAMTDDGQGRLSGNAGVGFIDYASGHYSLYFTTAPDDDTAITASYSHGAAAVEAGTLVQYVSATSGWVAIG
ncbi:MAG: hypothetical protein HY794_13330 [Desulfarculus sp.]|nr:hypothetical protein [Desulfarculus sp.]